MDAALQSISAKPFVKRIPWWNRATRSRGSKYAVHHVVVGIKNSDTTGAPASIVLQAYTIKYRQSLQRRKQPSSDPYESVVQ